MLHSMIAGTSPGYADCSRCGQLTAAADDGGDAVCWYCRSRDREPQGESVRLFQPAPNVMPGQLNIGG